MIISKMRLGSEICSCDTFTCIIIWAITFSDHYYYHFYYYRGHLSIYFMFQCCYYFIYKRKTKKYQKQKTRQFVTLMLQATVHHQHVLRELKIQK